MRVWDVRAPTPAAAVHGAHTAALLSLTAGVSEPQLLAASECGALLLLDARRPAQPVLTAQLHRSSSLCALSALAPGDTPLVAAGAEDGSVAVVDPRDLHVVATRAAHAGRVGGLAWLRAAGAAAGEGGVLLSGGWDQRLVRIALPAAAGPATGEASAEIA